jgi:hypothetical protein
MNFSVPYPYMETDPHSDLVIGLFGKKKNERDT